MRRAIIAMLIGLTLVVTVAGGVLAQEIESGLVQHTIEAGDTLSSIGEEYGFSAQEIADFNDISLDAALTPGDVLDIPLWTVGPEDTLYAISRTVGRTVAQMAAYNGLENPNLIYDGTQLRVPPADYVPPGTTEPPAGSTTATGEEEEEEEETSAPVTGLTPPPAVISNSGVTVTFDPILYAGDGRMAEVMIHVTNNSVEPAVAGGLFHINRDPVDGGLRWVTLLGAIQDTIPYPEIQDEPLWHATVYTDDGLEFPAYAGCIYREGVFAEGDEPLDRRLGIWFHWTMELEGGWFDCGNEYRVKPEDIEPGESGSAPLQIYLVHPRDFNTVMFGDRTITRIDLELFDTNGQSLGIVHSETYP
jgi:LysM repeat protein